MNRDVETQAFLWKMLLYFVEEMPTEVLKSGWILEVPKKKKKLPGLAPDIKLLWKSWLETTTCDPKVQVATCSPV